MKLGERGQVTIPKEIREFMGLGQDAEVDWRGYCKTSLADLKYESVDAFIDDVRKR